MEFFDSHAHYNDEKFNEDRESIIKNVYEEGVTKFICAGYSVESSIQALKIANEHDFIYTTLGVSPNDVKESIEETEKDIEEIKKIILEDRKNNSKPPIVGIGEIGLDYYWNKENKEVQKWAFIKQIELANELKLPIVIHTRDAVADTISILKEYNVIKHGVFHCCPQNIELVKEGLKLGFYISCAGPYTFKSAKNSEDIIKLIPDDKILIETDSPYLAPEPKRGTRNDSRNVKYIAEKIAKAKEKDLETVAQMTYKNACQIFEI